LWRCGEGLWVMELWGIAFVKVVELWGGIGGDGAIGRDLSGVMKLLGGDWG